MVKGEERKEGSTKCVPKLNPGGLHLWDCEMHVVTAVPVIASLARDILAGTTHSSKTSTTLQAVCKKLFASVSPPAHSRHHVGGVSDVADMQRMLRPAGLGSVWDDLDLCACW